MKIDIQNNVWNELIADYNDLPLNRKKYYFSINVKSAREYVEYIINSIQGESNDS